MVACPFALTRKMPLVVPATPWEQPLPAVIAYIVLPMKAMSATPLVKPLLVSLDGKSEVTTVRLPALSTLEIPPLVRLPVYGPTGPGTCSHWPPVDIVPPTPPSAT